MDVKTYKKTATIDAVKWDGFEASTNEIIQWAAKHGSTIYSRWDFDSDNHLRQYLNVPTLEGTMKASVGDFIARGINDEFWPIKPDIMEKTYQEVQCQR